VSELTVNPAAATVPNRTAVAPVNPEPVTVTAVPPASGPEVGLTPVTTGRATYEKRSALLVGLVPAGVVTVTSTVPEPAGEVAVTWVSETTVKPVAAVDPKLTPVAPVNPVPVIVTSVPPAAGPEVGLIPVTVGPDATYVKRSPAWVGLVPAGVVTVTSTMPDPAGETAVTSVSETTLKLVATVDPKLTPVAPVKPEPVMVTDVPPAVGPDVGEMPETDGPPV
jgi:hypothetical protein